MKILKKWYATTFRLFRAIKTSEAKELGLIHKENIYGEDSINRLNCRSVWVDSKHRVYWGGEIYNPYPFKKR